jgi:hypothetical protein
MSADVQIRNAAPFFLMKGLSPAGREFVRTRASRLDQNGEVNIGYAGYQQAIADAATAGLTVVEQG